jgi:predicted dehydrogenase
MSLLRAALVGTGHWGPNLARSLINTQKVTLAWVCDLNPQAMENLAERFPGARTTLDVEEVFSDPGVEAVAISTPTHTHYALARRALMVGKHVLVEKPITTSLGQALDLVGLAESRKLILMVGHVFHYNSGLAALKDVIDSGELGEVYLLNFERTNLGPVRTDVNALWDLASHDISTMYDLLGRPPDSVSATGRVSLNPGIEDVVFATFNFSDGPCAHVHASWLNPRKVRQLTVVGSKRMAIWDDLNLRAPLQIIEKHVQNSPHVGIVDSYLEYKTLCVDGGSYLAPVQLVPPLQTECEHFVQCIRDGKPPRTDGRYGALVVQILEAATSSLKQGGSTVPCHGAQELLHP